MRTEVSGLALHLALRRIQLPLKLSPGGGEEGWMGANHGFESLSTLKLLLKQAKCERPQV